MIIYLPIKKVKLNDYSQLVYLRINCRIEKNHWNTLIDVSN